MSKFREFWVYSNEVYAPTYACDFNQRGFVPSLNRESIHVIEYAALEQANAKIKELETKLTNYMLGFATQTERCELLEAKLAIAVETLEFYAHGDNWGHIEPGTHYVTNIYQCVDKTDYGEGDFTISERMNIDDSGVGGKRAREALKEFKSKVGVK